jgi:class 3 adenylate cyclase
VSTVDDLNETVETVFDTEFKPRDGTVIPETQDVALKDGAVKLDATFLYADLAGSSRLAKMCPWMTTAKIIRAYLDCATRLIRKHDGAIRSFDGDRVMGVFIGEVKNTQASYAAREIFYAVEKIIDPKAREKFKSVRENDIRIRNCVGLDTGTARAVRAGIRNSNDLIWIGKAPGLAAKLSDIRTYPYSVYASTAVYRKLADEAKIADGESFWLKDSTDYAGEAEPVYKTRRLKTP